MRLIRRLRGFDSRMGFIVCGDGTRDRAENDESLRAWVLDLADQIRAASPEWRSRFRLSPNPASAARAGCEGIGDRLRNEGDFRHALNLLRLEYKVVNVTADFSGNPDIVERLVPTDIKLLHRLHDSIGKEILAVD